MELKEFWEDASWAEKNYHELQRRYHNRWVAIVDGKVVSAGENRGEVKKRALELTEKKHIALIYVESGAAIY